MTISEKKYSEISTKKKPPKKIIQNEMLKKWAKNGYLNIVKPRKKGNLYIDSKDEKNAETIRILKEKMPHASNYFDFNHKYNFSSVNVNTLIAEKKIIPVLEKCDEVKHSLYFLIDESAEETQNAIKERHKVVPFPSTKYYKDFGEKKIYGYL